jgi:hypothetical protein
MPNENEQQRQVDNPGTEPPNPADAKAGPGPGGDQAGVVGTIVLIVYLVAFTLFVIYSLVKIWPSPTPSREPAPTTQASSSPSPSPSPSTSPAARTTLSPSPTGSAAQSPSPVGRGNASPGLAATSSPTPTPTPTPCPACSGQTSTVSFLGSQFEISDEQRLLLLVILAGALGTLVHSVRSVYWYVGNRDLVRSWLAMYFMLPFAGSALSLVFYLVVRGGFFSPQSGFQQTSPFGFAAFAALIGMFSSQAVLKLKEVAEVLLSKPVGGANSNPQPIANPATGPIQPPAGGNPSTGGNAPAGGNPPTGGNPPAQH